jgi:antitoxin ParD1/3/4
MDADCEVSMPSPAKVSKVSVALTAEMAEMVHHAVSSGEYASGSEVIREALREWKLRRTLKLSGQEELRRLWAEGLASGPSRFDSIDAIKGEARRRLKAGTTARRR